jgi:hypothetical protein
MHTRKWHTNAVPANVQGILARLGAEEALEGTYLAGGTALALYFGHRISMDLDFFRTALDEEIVLAELHRRHVISVISKGRGTLHLHVEGVKVSLLEYPYPVLFPYEDFQGLPLADPRDIACMKLSAIAGRGSKRDFVDCYMLANRFGLSPLLDLFKSKYSGIHYNLIHVMKSLTYFEDADKEPMPNMLADLSWEQVKAFFLQAVPGLV